MAATIDTYTSRNQLPANPANTTLAVVVEPGKVISLYVFVGGIGWLQAAHGAANN